MERGTTYQADNDEYDPNYTISNYKVVAVSAEYTSLAKANSTPEPSFGQITSSVTNLDPNTNPAILTTPLVLNYIACADVTLPALGPDGHVVAKIRRVFSKQQISPWNWAIFYVDPLEIHPGPSFTVTGWVHTNSDLYTAHNTLIFADKVTFGSDWSIGFKPGDGQHPGETPQSPSYPNNLPPARDQSLQPFGLDSSSIFNSSDSNPNNDSYLELIQPPSAGYTDPLQSARYWNQADIVIQVSDNPNPNAKGFDGVNGHDLVTIGTGNTDGTITAFPASNNLYKMVQAAITTNQTIQDNREAATIKLTTLNVSKLETGAGLNPNYDTHGTSFNGIIYVYDKSATSGARRGVRLTGGSKIPTLGLTVASANPVYVQGDFNTGGTGTSVPSNQSNAYSDPNNPPNPQVSGYSRSQCSVIADAVNVLSSNWNDGNSSAGLGSRIASNTTVNAAIVSGIVPTAAPGGDGSYSGGAENFPRFLEDWGSATLSYYGSMVELYKSAQATGEWGKANVYSPPTRKWFFDTNFKTLGPPGSLMIHSYIKGRWTAL